MACLPPGALMVKPHYRRPTGPLAAGSCRLARHKLFRRISHSPVVQFHNRPCGIDLQQFEGQAFATDGAKHLVGGFVYAVAEALVIHLNFEARFAAAYRLHDRLQPDEDLVPVVLGAFEGGPGIDDLSPCDIDEVDCKAVGGNGALRKPKHLGASVDPRQLATAGADPMPAGGQGPFKTAVPVEQDGFELLHADPLEAEQRHDALPEQRRNPGPRAGDHGDDDQGKCYRPQKFTHAFPSLAMFFIWLTTL